MRLSSGASSRCGNNSPVYCRTGLPHRSHSISAARPLPDRISGASATKPSTSGGNQPALCDYQPPGRAEEVFAFYSDHAECENPIEEFKGALFAQTS